MASREAAEDAALPRLSTPEAFAFPYERPYDIQLDLMRTVFRAIEDRKIAIVSGLPPSPRMSLVRAESWPDRVTDGNWKIVDPPDGDSDMVATKSKEA